MISKALIAAACLLVASLSAGAAAAQDLYVKISDVAGTSVANGRTDWIELTAMTEGFSIPAQATGRSSGKGTFEDITLTKALDAASIKLKEFAVSGKRVAQIEIEMVRKGTRPVVAYRITLKNVMITSVDMAASSDSGLEETVTLAFEEIGWSFWPQLPNGQTGQELKWGWNIAKGIKQ